MLWNCRANTDGTLYATNQWAATDADLVEKTLGTYTLPGSSLTTSGQSIKVTAWFAFAGNGNAKTVKIKIGSKILATNNVTAAPNGVYGKLEATIECHSADTWMSHGEGLVGAVPQTIVRESDLAWVPANPLVITVTGQNGAASGSEIILDQLHVQTINQYL